MKSFDKYWIAVKKKSPTILAVLGSFGTAVTAYLAAKNEAIYQNNRFEYHMEHGMFPEECFLSGDMTKDELRKRAYRHFGIHVRQHATTILSGGLTIASILGGNAVGVKQNAALMAMNVGIGNMMAQRRNAEDKIVESQSVSQPITRENIQDYLIREAFANDIIYYTDWKKSHEPGTEMIWLDVYPSNKIFIVSTNDVNSLPWFINKTIKEQNYVSYGEIFDYLNLVRYVGPDFFDEDINGWIYMYGFSKEEDDELKIEVYSRQVEVEDGVYVTALSFSSVGKPIMMM